MTFAVLQYPADALLLRRKARPIREDEFGTPALLAFAHELGETMTALNGLGLAATQVGEHPGGEPWAIFALRVRGPDAGVPVLGFVCNPVLVSQADERIGPEGCLSFASVSEALRAPERVTVAGQSPLGRPFEMALEGEMARCAYHETHHLRGLLFIDRMSPMKRGLFLRAVQKARRQG